MMHHVLLYALACTHTGGEMPAPHFESDTTAALMELARTGSQGDTALLSTLRPGTWTGVYYFDEGTPKAKVDGAVGFDLVGDNGYLSQPGPLLVFVHETELVEAVYALPPLSLRSRGRYFTAAEATIRLHTKPPAPYGLVLETRPTD